MIFIALVDTPTHVDTPLFHSFISLFPDSEVEGDDELVDGTAPTLKRRRLAREDGLQKALASGLYPEFLGVAGPVNRMNPSSDSTLDFLKLLWPDSLCEHIAGETNEYARQVNWLVEMRIHRVPRIVNYWSRNLLLLAVSKREYCSGLVPG